MAVRNKGQTIVEFALVVPMMVLIFLTTIYAGITFLDYLQYNNAARAAARDISITSSGSRANLIDNINKQEEATLKRYATPIAKLYSPNWTAEFLDEAGNHTDDETKAYDVHINITLSRDKEILNFLPKNLKSIDCQMRLE